MAQAVTLDIDKRKVYFNVSGTLSDRIKDLTFICDLFKNKNLWIGNMLVIKDIEELDESYIYFSFLKDIKSLLDYFNVNYDLDMDKLTDNQLKFLDLLIRKVLYNEEKVLQKHFKEVLQEFKTAFGHLEIANLNITVIIEIDNNENITIKTFDNFDSKKVRAVRENVEFDTTIYSILTSNDFVKSSNLNFENLSNSIKNIPLNENYADQVNTTILELIKAYDIDNKLEICLKTALDLCHWLESYNKESLIYKLNRLQIIKRMRELSEEEISFLIKTKQSNDLTDEILCGICILIDSKYEFQSFFQMLTPEKQEMFREYPIYHLTKDFTRKDL